MTPVIRKTVLRRAWPARGESPPIRYFTLFHNPMYIILELFARICSRDLLDIDKSIKVKQLR